MIRRFCDLQIERALVVFTNWCRKPSLWAYLLFEIDS